MGLDSLNASMWGSTTDAAAYFSRWDGFEFTDPTRVTPMGMEIFTASWAGPDIAAFGDTIYVVCKENPEDMAPAYCIHSYDGGATFSEPVVVDGMLGDNISRFPSVAVNEEGQPIVAFMRLEMPDTLLQVQMILEIPLIWMFWQVIFREEMFVIVARLASPLTIIMLLPCTEITWITFVIHGLEFQRMAVICL